MLSNIKLINACLSIIEHNIYKVLTKVNISIVLKEYFNYWIYNLTNVLPLIL